MTKCEQLLRFAGSSAASRDKQASAVAKYLKTNPTVDLQHVAATLHTQSSANSPFRRIAVLHPNAQQNATFTDDPAKLVWSSDEIGRNPTPAFLFSGIGDHYSGMAAQLAATELAFRDALQACDDIIQRERNQSLFAWLNAEQKSEKLDLRALLGRSNGAQAQTAALDTTAVAHPFVFAVEYALTQLLAAWGVRPAYVMGYSLGEFVAACVAGILSLDDALTFVMRRAALIEAAPEGRMLAVPLPLAEAEGFVSAEISLAAHNAPNLTVLSGATAAIEALHQQLQANAIPARQLNTRHAFHSHMLEPLHDELAELAGSVVLNRPKIPVISCITGDWLTDAQATDPAYWVSQMCHPVRFFGGLQTLLASDATHFIEVGPGQSLGAFLKQHPNAAPDRLRNSFPTLPYSYDAQSDRALFLTTLGKLWLSGIDIVFPSAAQQPTIPALTAALTQPHTNTTISTRGRSARRARRTKSMA